MKIDIETMPAIIEPITSDIKSKFVSLRPCWLYELVWESKMNSYISKIQPKEIPMVVTKIEI